MRNLLLLLALFLGTCGPALAQKLSPTSLTVPDSLRTGNSVVLASEEVYEVTGPSSATYSYRRVVTLFNGKEQGGNTLQEAYDGHSKITRFEAASYDWMGNQMGRARNSDIEDRRHTSEGTFYEDTRYKTVTVPCTSYPCTVVFEVEKRLNEIMLMFALSSWQPQAYEQGVVSSSLTVTVPAENELLYQSSHLLPPAITLDDRNRRYRWEVSNLPAQNSEPYTPSVTAVLPFLRVALADFEIEGYRGSYRSWKDFGTFIGSILEGRDQLPPQLRQQVREVVAGATTEHERVDRLYRFMQQRMRYVSIQLGIGGWQPFSAEYVEQNRFGDCKALSNYMGAMLKEVGIVSYPVLINASEQPYYPVTEDFTSSAFNHMVLYVPSQELYLECTSHTAPTGYLSEATQDRNVVWITPQGGELHRTPRLEPTENGHTRTVNVQLAADGTTTLQLGATHYGGEQEQFRGLVDYVGDPAEQLQRLHRYNYLPDVSGSDYQLDVDPRRPHASLRYATKVNNYARKMGTRLFVPINPYYGYDWIPERNEDRRLPIETHTTRYWVDTVNVQLPAGMEIESGVVTDPLVYTHAAGTYRSEMQPTKDGVRWIRILKLLPVSLPADEYAAFREFYVNVANAERAQLVVRQQRTK